MLWGNPMHKIIKIGLALSISLLFLSPVSLVIADDIPPIITVYYPNGGEIVVGQIDILWSAIDNETINLNGTILLEYSPDNGTSWVVIASGENNTGVYLWDTTVVPDGDAYLIRVSATDASNNTGSDTSDGPFSVDNVDTVPPEVVVIYPNGGEVVSGEVSIQWSASDDVTMDLNGTILLEFSPDNGMSWVVIASGEDNTGVYLWNTTVVPDGNQYLIAVSATDEAYNVGSDVSDGVFSINNVLNDPPSNPQVLGPSYGGNGIVFNFTAIANDPEGEMIRYKWDWGDGNVTDWLGPFNSGEPMILSYAWASNGNYSLRVKAEDTNGSESNWSLVHLISIAEHINFSNVQLGHIYFKLFSFNRSFIFSDFLKQLSVVIILTSHPLDLQGYATEYVKSVTFQAENQIQPETLVMIDDDASDGFNCIMNVTRGVYVLNITAYDENGSLIDHYSLFTVFFIRIGRYATGPGPTYLNNIRTRTANLRLRR